MQRLCGVISTSVTLKLMVKLICHKALVEVVVKSFSEGFGFGESANHIQHLYGFFFYLRRDYSPVVLVPEEYLYSL